MIKKYLYNGKEYLSDYQVRQAIFEMERKAFPEEPEENKAEFWNELGVTYAEEPDPEPTPEEIQAKLTYEVQRVLDNEAKKLGYDSCLSVCSYVDTGVPKFDAEGKAFRAWRSAVWSKGYEILAEVKEGKREIPTIEDLIAELPKLVIDYVA